MPDEPSQISEWVSNFRDALLQLDQDLCAYLGQNPTVEELCADLVQLNLAKAELSMIYDHFAATVGDAMGKDQEIILENGAKIEKKFSNSRTGWQHKDLAGQVAKKITDLSIDMDTGEVIYSTEELISQVLDYLQPSYWRVKELQKIGINPDHYCEVGDTKTSIIVRKGAVK